jgi:hypothetical protein
MDYKRKKRIVPEITPTGIARARMSRLVTLEFLGRFLTKWDFWSYPESYPSQSRAAMGPLAIGWAAGTVISRSQRH